MKFHTRYLVAAALLAAPVSAAAQTAPPAAAQGEHAREGRRGGPGDVRGHGGPGGSPVQGILRQRERLQLTADQVSRLEAIDRDLQARTAPLREQLTAIFPERAQRADGPNGERRGGARGGRGERREDGRGARGPGRDRPQLTAEQRQQMEQRRTQAQPIMEQLRQQGEQAMTQAGAVLTPQQQEQLRARGEGRDGRRGSGRGEHGERGGQPRGDSTRSR